MINHTEDTSDKIAVIGLGFVGLPLAGTFAEIGMTVTGIDKHPVVLESLKNGKSHFEEFGLQELLDRQLGKNLTITDSLEPGAHGTYIIAVGTPVDPATRKPIMEYVESASRMVGSMIKKGDLVIMRSTVPVGITREIVLPALEEESGMKVEQDFDLMFAPERLVAGRALQELRELPQIIGGVHSKANLDRAITLFKKLTPEIVTVESLESAEMAKIIDNSYRDLTFAYANQMALLCEKIGINMNELAGAVNLNYKRNHVPRPSPGVGGTCLTKDPYILMQFGEKYGYVPPLAKVARDINESMTHHVSDKACRLLTETGKDPKESTVLVLGYAFKGKPVTSDTRDSPTQFVVDDLIKAGCTVLGYDPVVPDTRIAEMGGTPVELADGFAKADAVILMTNHPDFEGMNLPSHLETMKKPAVCIDGWYMHSPEDIRAVEGISYGGLGND
jgi:UDP-N-acetyl-D-mannosaminuronic acid dehydrogenase